MADEKGPREVIRRVALWPEHIPIRVGGETLMLNDAADEEYTDAVIRWLRPFSREEREDAK
jgi:hypothetical protein